MRLLAVSSLLLCGVWVGARQPDQYPEGWRLVRVAPEVEFWASPEQVNSLAVYEVGFVDVTDIHDLEAFAATHRHAPQVYPTTMAHHDLVEDLFADFDMQNFFDTLKIFTENPGQWNTRHAHTEQGVLSAKWLLEQVTAVSTATGVGSVTTFDNPQFGQFNVIARIEGDGSDDNMVIIGAHQDSIVGFNSASVAPGADDDGSGSMMLLEVFRVLGERIRSGEFLPKRPIEFHWYAGEEGGLVGSRNQAAAYAERNAPVYSMFQFDMIGFPDPDKSDLPIGVVTDYTDTALNQFLRDLIDAYLTIGWQDRPCGYGCSDHASWTSAGYPAVFPFEAPFGSHNGLIHTVSDTIANGVSEERVTEFSHLSVAYLVEASLA